jgi:PRTRC genetic system protein B
MNHASLLHSAVDENTLALTNAILLYQSSSKENKSCFATVHRVEPPRRAGERPRIQAGVPVTRSALLDTLASLSAHDSFGFLPENLLSVGNGYMVWWSKPQERTMYFRADAPLGERCGVTPHPALVFATYGNNQWAVFAVKGDARPTPDTPLYQAPYFNVYSDGRICTGNVALPNASSVERIAAYEKAFFGSYFTHPNVREKGKLTRYKRGAYSLWKALLDGKEKTFPQDSLVPVDLTAGKLVENVISGKLK